MYKKPIISIVVPTKNRYKYLKYLLELFDTFDSDEFEVVVQDNSDDNTEIQDFFEAKDRSYLRYHHTSKYLTSIENFNQAISNANGDYVCFIGDDDGVCLNIISAAKWMKSNNIEAARSSEAGYMWPDTGKCGGCVDYEENNSVFFHYLNPVHELYKIMKSGFSSLGDIPLLYNGIVKKDILDLIYSRYHTFFPGGSSADIANGVALCFYVKRFVKIYTPLIIRGTSAKTGSVSDRNKLLPLKEVSFISHSVAENWEGDIPNYWLNVFVWPESAIKSLRVLNKEELINYINYNRILGTASWRLGISYKSFLEYGSGYKILYYKYTSLTRKVFKALKIRVRSYLFRDSNNLPFRRVNVKNIIEAESLLRVKIDWENCKILK